MWQEQSSLLRRCTVSCGMEAFSAWSCLHRRPMSGCGMPLIHLRFSFHVDEHSSYKVPVEVMCRLTHLFEHEIDTTRQLHAHRGNLLGIGVGPQTIFDHFVEVTKALPRAEREALWCRSNLARVNFPRYWPGCILAGTSDA